MCDERNESEMSVCDERNESEMSVCVTRARCLCV